MAGFKFKLEEGGEHSNSTSRRKKVMLLIAALVLVGVGTVIGLFVIQQNSSPVSPSDEFVLRAMKAMDEDNQSEISKIVGEVKSVNRYETSPDYLALLTALSIERSDVAEAEANLAALKATGDVALSSQRWGDKKELLSTFEHDLKILKEFREAEKERKHSAEGEV